MQRWREEFVVNNQRKCVHVHHNGDFDHGKILYIEPDWEYLDFVNAASHRLNVIPAANRVFNADGVEVDDCMMIEDNDILFLSAGEDFIVPADTINSEFNDNKNENEKLPSIVGGYRVGELLGRGGFGEVRVGEHQLTGDRVALKFLRKSEIHSLGAAERTNTEIQCLTALKHANIIRLQHHLEAQNYVVLVFELMEGGDLSKYLIKRKSTGFSPRCSLSEEETRHVFYQLISGVSYAHNQHICHRDLKLENILLKDNTLNVVKIADFGLSDFYRPGATMKTNCGTLSFLAPEVFQGTANAGPPLDVWALGVILFALLCGRLPFEGTDLSNPKRPRDAVIRTRIVKGQYKIEDSLGSDAKDLIRRMLQADPNERITLSEIFNHSWIRTGAPGCCNDSMAFVQYLHQMQQIELIEQQGGEKLLRKGSQRQYPGEEDPNKIFQSSPNAQIGYDSNASPLKPKRSSSYSQSLNNAGSDTTKSRKNSASSDTSGSPTSSSIMIPTSLLPLQEEDEDALNSSLRSHHHTRRRSNSSGALQASSDIVINKFEISKDTNESNSPLHNLHSHTNPPVIKLIPLRRTNSKMDQKHVEDDFNIKGIADHEITLPYRPQTSITTGKRNTVSFPKETLEDELDHLSISSNPATTKTHRTHRSKDIIRQPSKSEDCINKDCDSLSSLASLTPKLSTSSIDHRRGTVSLPASSVDALNKSTNFQKSNGHIRHTVVAGSVSLNSNNTTNNNNNNNNSSASNTRISQSVQSSPASPIRDINPPSLTSVGKTKSHPPPSAITFLAQQTHQNQLHQPKI